MKIDLHVHSEHSWDSKVPIKTYISLAEQMDFGAIAITDHNSTQSHNEIKRLQQSTNVLLIPGQEINTLEGHLLIYGWIDLLPRDLTMRQTVELARSKGMETSSQVVCIAAHPFDWLRSGGGTRAMESGVDGLEILNASSLLSYVNWKARRYAVDRILITLGNSDCHRSSEFGFAYSTIEPASNIEDLFRNLNTAIPGGKRIGLYRKTNRFIRRKLGLMSD